MRTTKYRSRVGGLSRASWIKVGLLCVLGLMPAAQALVYTNLHNFQGGTNGSLSYSGPLLNGSNLYGMTRKGGSSGSGIVYRVSTNGSGFTVLHHFGGGAADGAEPWGALTLNTTTLYGMTSLGGVSNMGTVFKVNTDGTGYTLLHHFGGDRLNDGARPYYNTLLISGGTIYGMTQSGGSNSLGMVFRMDLAGGAYTNLHTFRGDINDGSFPEGGLALYGATLYGAASFGGIGTFGVIFRMGLNGSGYTNLYLFHGANDGARPVGSLIFGGATMYGMTQSGGTFDFGTIFKLKADGSTFSKLHDFADAPDGVYPQGSLLLHSPTLYGMTPRGGNTDFGVLFRLNTNGANYTILHHFDMNSSCDGFQPDGSLVRDGATLYGAALNYWGGGNGVLFAFALSNNPAILLQQGAGGIAGHWDLQDYQPAAWSPMGQPLGGNWVIRAMRQNRALLQQGDGGLVGLWGLNAAGTPTNWWAVSGPMPGWIMRDYDSGRILLQQGDGGTVGIWTLNPANNTPATWTLLSNPLPGLIARSLCGQRVLIQFANNAGSGFWTLNGANNVTAWTPITAQVPAGWILRSLSPSFILLQGGEGGQTGLWELNALGQPILWHPVSGAMPGWSMRGLDGP